MNVFLTFQGGGARGIVHVGGLRSVEASQLEIQGAAGTSAGAIIAALVAAGYKADEIVSASGDEHLLQNVANGDYKSPKQLFTTPGWSALKVLRGIWWARYIFVALILGCFLKWLFFPTIPTVGQRCGIALLMLISICVGIYCFLGIAPLDRVEKVVDEAISNGSLVPRLKGRKNITFAEFFNAGGKPLKIVATNVSTQTFEVFSADKTPDMSIAKAVSASICIPIVFKPKRLAMKRPSFGLRGWKSRQSTEMFVDGGLSSNLPLWTFDEERLVEPETLTIGFQLKDEKTYNKAVSWNWLAPLLGTIINGSVKIHARGVPGLLLVSLPTSLKLLDFNLKLNKYQDAIATCHDSSLQYLDEQLNAPGLVVELLKGLISNIIEETEDPQNSESFVWGVSLYVQKPDYKVIVEQAAQAGALVPIPRFTTVKLDGCVLGDAWRDQSTKFSSLSQGHRFGLSEEWDWLVVVPLFTGEPGEAAILVVIQASDLREDDWGPTLEVRKKVVASHFEELVHAFDAEKQLGLLARGSQLWN